jgi:hypothetical protein
VEKKRKTEQHRGRMRLPPKCLPAGFETADLAERRRDRMIRVLQRDPERFATQIDMLEKCVGGAECRQRNCDVCMRATRLHLLRGGCKHFRSMALSGEVIAFSIVLLNETGVAKRGPPDFRRLWSRLARRLQRIPLPVPRLIAGIDVSLNEDGGRLFWQVQLYGVTHAANEEAVWDEFDDPDSEEHVVQVSRCRSLCTDLCRVLTYAVKTQFVRRVSYIDRKGHRNTRKVGLTNSQRRLVAWWLRDVRCWDTVFLVGLTRRGDRLVPLRKRSKLSFSKRPKVPRRARARPR